MTLKRPTTVPVEARNRWWRTPVSTDAQALVPTQKLFSFRDRHSVCADHAGRRMMARSTACANSAAVRGVAVLLLWSVASLLAAADNESAVAIESVSGRDCHVRMVLRSGEDCAYPGTDERFRVHAGGQAGFLAATVSGSIDISGELDGRRYDIAATDLGEGSWRIDRVEAGRAGGGAGTAAEAAGAPIALRGLQCVGKPSVDGTGMDIRIEGQAHARTGVSSVTLTGRIESELVDVSAIGRIGGGDSAGFALQGLALVPHTQVTALGCAVDVEYFDIGALRYGQPLRVKWQGYLAK